MDTNKFSWLTDGPVDYELKRYKMLAVIQKLTEKLSQNRVWPVIEDVENQLDNLYKTKYEIEIKDENNRVAKDIDFFNFEIIYEDVENDEVEECRIVDDIVEDAIIEFGDVYMEARTLWREIEKDIHLTWIPKRPSVLNEGYAIIIHEGICHAYSFIKPTKMNNSWRTLKLEFVKSFEFSNTSIVKFYDDYQNEEETLMFCRIGTKVNGLPFEDSVLPIAKSVLFGRIVSDFA